MYRVTWIVLPEGKLPVGTTVGLVNVANETEIKVPAVSELFASRMKAEVRIGSLVRKFGNQVFFFLDNPPHASHTEVSPEHKRDT